MAKKARFQSTKVIEGFSTCFRQWKAIDTHCSKLHGYAISFKVVFEGPLDDRNWVMDFGFMKRCKTGMKLPATKTLATPDQWFRFMFDHTVLVAQDDPFLQELEYIDALGVMQIRILPAVGCEKFAQFVFQELNKFLYKETEDRVCVVSVECFEHSKNSAIYSNQ